MHPRSDETTDALGLADMQWVRPGGIAPVERSREVVGPLAWGENYEGCEFHYFVLTECLDVYRHLWVLRLIGTGARLSLARAKHDLASLRRRPPRRILIIRVACRGNEKRA